jgi:hypothetical protein
VAVKMSDTSTRPRGPPHFKTDVTNVMTKYI